MRFILLLLLLASPASAEIIVSREPEGLLLRFTETGEYKAVEVSVDGRPVEIYQPHGRIAGRIWVAKTDADHGRVTAVRCDDSSCTPFDEEFAVPSPILWPLLLATVAGFLMNFMPCVLPVLGLKLLCFQKANRVYYVLGVLVSFMIIATLAVFAGAGLSHMSAPMFRVGLAVVCALMAAKLFGYWEVPSTGLIGSIAGRVGPFGTGLLTVALGSSCSVPFVAPVLLAVARSPWWQVYLLFGGMGVGFCGPFILPVRFPKIKKLHYTLYFERICAVAMSGVSVWVLSTLSRDNVGYSLLTISAGLFFLRISSEISWVVKVGFGAVFSGLIALAIFSPNPEPRVKTTEVFPVDQPGPYVVYVTADWCVNCKFVEGVWSDPLVVEAMQKGGYTFNKLDWTNNETWIEDFLGRYNHKSVPFALVKHANGSWSTLSSIYTRSDVLKVLEPQPFTNELP